jgi:hypothetical protein
VCLALSVVGDAVALGQSADCEPQRFFPDFQARDLEFGMGVAINDEHLLVADRFGGAKIYCYSKDGQGHWALRQTVPGGGVGASLDLSGDRFVTGSFDVPFFGGALVYDFDGQHWTETGRMGSPDIAFLSPWGNETAIHGRLAALANWGSAVLTFYESDSGWQFTADLDPTPVRPDRTDFGNALMVDDRFLIVGAPGEPVTGIQNGAVYVYAWDADGLPVPTQKLLPEPAPLGPRLGTSIDLDGDTMVVGAREYRIGDEFGLGAAYVYTLRDGLWELDQMLFAPTLVRGSQFGWDVAIDGDTIAVGAITEGRGAVYLYRRGDDGLWRHAERVTLDIPGLEYGEAVDLSATQLVVGGSDVFSMGFDQGVADVYDLDCLLCTPDLDADGALTIFDFLLFFNLFQDGDPLADFDGDGELTLFDFLAFQTAFDAGCQ